MARTLVSSTPSPPPPTPNRGDMKRALLALFICFLIAAAPGPAVAQQRTITGRVTSEQGAPLNGVTVSVKGTSTVTSSNTQGDYTIAAEAGQILQFRLIGTALMERAVGTEDVINVQLRRVALDLDAVVVTALGETASQRSLGTAQQSVRGAEIAETQRENFFNALSGRVAGVDVTSTSGVPIDNRTVNTGVLASDKSSVTAFSNRGVDFTNRAADLNSQDIETLTVLKGPEAAALYGIDAANGAIVIKTKRGRAGGGMQYSSTVRVEATRANYQLQRVYGPSSLIDGSQASLQYFGAPYPAGTQFYDNIDGFLRKGLSQNHNLSFSGATADNTINYRLSTSLDKQEGVVHNSDLNKINVTGSSQARINSWLNTDLSMIYSYANNDQVYKGDIGPLMGLMLWPQTDDARNYLTPAGTRRLVTAIGAGTELDNPYFNVAKNKINAKTNRLIANVGVVVTPFSWGNIKTNLGTDNYTTQNLLLRHPESVTGYSQRGILDLADVISRNLSALTLLNVNNHALTNSFSLSGFVGHQVSDFKSTSDAQTGINFLDPNFVSMNNTGTRSTLTTIEQRRLVSLFGQAVLDYKDYWYVTLTGRNDWTSTIPRGRNSFFYPSVSTSFVFSDAF